MKLIEQSWEWVKEPEEWIEQAGRICYKTEKKITDTSSPKFIRMLRKSGHHAMLEHSIAAVKFITNRAFTHELVRHRLAAFAQESTRYVKYDDLQIIIPVWWSWMESSSPISIETGDFPLIEDARAYASQRVQYAEMRKGPAALKIFNDDTNLMAQKRRLLIEEISVWLYSHMISQWSYGCQLDCGSIAERARGVLPNDLKTEIIMACNLREWRHIFSLRCDKAAHPQIRVMMKDLLVSFNKRIPAIFEDLHGTLISK